MSIRGRNERMRMDNKLATSNLLIRPHKQPAQPMALDDDDDVQRWSGKETTKQPGKRRIRCGNEEKRRRSCSSTSSSYGDKCETKWQSADKRVKDDNCTRLKVTFFACNQDGEETVMMIEETGKSINSAVILTGGLPGTRCQRGR